MPGVRGGAEFATKAEKEGVGGRRGAVRFPDCGCGYTELSV